MIIFREDELTLIFKSEKSDGSFTATFFIEDESDVYRRGAEVGKTSPIGYSLYRVYGRHVFDAAL